MAAKMKSLSAYGIVLGVPRPSPRPATPPSPMPYSDCTICQPLPYWSFHGSSQMSTRVCTWPNIRHET